MKKLNVCKIIDQFGWAYYFTTKEQQRYSNHNIFYAKSFNIISEMDKFDIDIMYLPSPDAFLKNTDRNKVIEKCRQKNIKIIGAYSGEIPTKYIDSDLIVSISANYLHTLRHFYPDKPVIFLPESVDTDFFIPTKFNKNNFKVGWAGSYTRPIKRTHLLKELDFSIKVQCNRNFSEEKTLQPMLDFYHSVNAIILVSETECMPRVILEAMSCGLPIISTDVGSVKMLLDKEWIIQVYPEQEVINKMNEKLSIFNKYTSLRREVGRRNRRHVKRFFSWKRNQILWDKIFEALYADDFDKIKEIDEKFYTSFNYLYSEQIKIKKPIVHLLTIREILLKLNNSPVFYWVLKNTCLDTIKNKRAESDMKVIYIGVKTSKESEKIKNIIKEIKTDVKVKIEEINPYRKTKPMPMYGFLINVPFPVVNYLVKEFGSKWNNRNLLK